MSSYKSISSLESTTEKITIKSAQVLRIGCPGEFFLFFPPIFSGIMRSRLKRNAG